MEPIVAAALPVA